MEILGCVPLGWSRWGSVIQDPRHSGCIPLGLSGSRSVIWDHWDHWDHAAPNNPVRWILVQSGFIGSFPATWSEWSRVADPDPEHPKGTHPQIIANQRNQPITEPDPVRSSQRTSKERNLSLIKLSPRCQNGLSITALDCIILLSYQEINVNKNIKINWGQKLSHCAIGSSANQRQSENNLWLQTKRWLSFANIIKQDFTSTDRFSWSPFTLLSIVY